MTIPPGTTTLVGLGAKQLRQFLRRNEVKNLLGLVAAEIARTPGIPPERVDDVRRAILGLRVDPQMMGGLKRLLDAGDTTATPLIEQRLDQILLPGDPALASLELPRLTAESLASNASRAKRDEKSATRLEGQLTRSSTSEQMSGLQREMRAGFEGLISAGLPSPRSIPDFGFPIGISRILEDLEEIDSGAATRLAAAINAGGTGRARELIETPQDWIAGGSAALWVALGRIADRGGNFKAAEDAYLRAAEMPDVSDRVRELVRASASAHYHGDSERSKELFEKARELDPQNPAVAIATARKLEDAEEILKQLDGVEPVDDVQAVLLELTMACAEAAREDFPSARRHIAAARGLDPDSPLVREVAANVALIEVQVGLPDEVPIDREALVDMAKDLLELGRELGEDGRPGASASVIARASQAFSLAEDHHFASAALEEALRIPDRAEAAEALAEAAFLLQRFDLIETLQPGDDEESRLARANASVLSERDVKAAAADLELLMGSDEEAVAIRAAFMRLAAASPVHDVPWSDEAEQRVATDKPEAVAVLKAEFLAEGDHIEEAEKVLAPFSSSPAPLRQLVGLAVRREDDDAALRLAEELISRYGEPRDRLNHAGLIARQGDRPTARDRYLMLARDPAVSDGMRVQAYGRAANLVMEAADHVDLSRISKEWLNHAPDDEDPVWLHVFSLARRRQYGEALAFWREHELSVGQLRQAIMLSEVFGFGAEPAEALERIAALSDQFDRPEELEYNLMTTALRTEGASREGIGEDLEGRVKQTFADFPERFPDSDWLKAYKIEDDDPSSFLEEIRPGLEARAELGQSLLEEVRRGTGATHVLAAANGCSLGEVWASLPALPLGFSENAIDVEERTAAAEALRKRSAVWDPTAIFVVGGLNSTASKTLRNALPASLIANSTFEDTTADVRMPKDKHGGHISFDPSAGGLVLSESSQEQLDREERRAASMAEMAKSFTVRVDMLREEAEKFDGDIEQISSAGLSWPATAAVAQREGLAVYSDDRFVRLAARGAGIPSFGTLVLLDVLTEQGAITAAERSSARSRIYQTGAWGMNLDREELIDLVRENDFEPTVGAFAVLNDVVAWPARGIEAVEVTLALLNAIHSERPEVFDRWVHRVVDSLTRSLGKDYEKWARFLISAVLNPFREPPCLSVLAGQALIDALRGLEYFRYFRPKSDMLLDAISEALSVADDERARAAYFRHLIDLLGPADRERAIKHFVRNS
jgi:tetratricopeptide (TPR) repeat protein